MENVTIKAPSLHSSRLIYGCMRLTDLDSTTSAHAILDAALEAGYTHFDHADIYGAGECEHLFGTWLQQRPGVRERITLTTKCGIRVAGDPTPDAPARYDFDPAYIIQQVESSLQRLHVEQIDLLLLHRPDYLFIADEIAHTFQLLVDAGKVKHFGLSNCRPSQLDLIAAACPMPIVNHQIEINLHNITAIENGTLDQCQKHGIRPSAWCPLGAVAYPAWGNTFSAADEARIADEIKRQTNHYQATPSQIALAWILRLPTGVLPIIGSTKAARIHEAIGALDLQYTREDWYRLLEARNGHPVP